MRRTARPFITEYKSRSSKSSAAHSPNIDGADKHDPTPSFLDHGVFVTSRSNAEDLYQVALKAADALFGRGNSAIPLQEETSSSNVRVGRVLPSLIADDDDSTVRSGNDGEKKSGVPARCRSLRILLPPGGESRLSNRKRP